MDKKAYSRRSLLGMGSSAGVAGALAALSPVQLSAASSNRAAVCIYLAGGNDSYNMLVPMAGYDDYARARGAMALRSSRLRPSRTRKAQKEYAFHPAMSALAGLFDSGALAAVEGVGGTQPSTHTDPDMFYLPNGYFTPAWAARAAGLTPVATSNAVLCAEAGVSAVRLAGGAPRRGRSRFAAAFPNTGIGRALAEVAGMLEASAADLGSTVYTVAQGGYDTHVDQNRQQSRLFADLAQAVAAFHDATIEIGVAERVVSYTISEFGRSLEPNSDGGTGHGWASTQLVLGGLVAGGEVYAESAPADGTPAISRARYESEVAAWVGVPYADLAGAMPVGFLG